MALKMRGEIPYLELEKPTIVETRTMKKFDRKHMIELETRMNKIF